ncbi:family 43 glycosylhydrolase [Aurantiacibacter suaedae]|uniref:family 43 glycosylhydrolase n=1 Tax=Aurantiacibacter suaedae TaxID=2545755 RepID=UPI0010F7019A|nr:family 43 glycosylhydrolase [Aurantiacibacter suaedae]
MIKLPAIVTLAASLAGALPAYAQPLSQAAHVDDPQRVDGNPIIRDRFTADPAPLTVDGTLYLYAGHDEGDEGFRIDEWVVYSTRDMKTWTNHGVLMQPTDFAWAEGEAWASQMVEHEGRFYFYTTVEHDDSHPGKAIGVAACDTPVGPCRDARGSALVRDNPETWRGWSDIDPTVLVDDDGTAWMAWGNSNLYLARLAPNMVELEGEVQELHLTNFLEGPWLHRRGNLYYLTYASFAEGEQDAEHLSYATAPAMTGPWTYRGELTGAAKNSFTIHAGIEKFNGQWYLFYHNGALSIDDVEGSEYRRSVAVEHLLYNEDGSLKPVVQTIEGVSLPPGAPGTPFEE